MPQKRAIITPAAPCDRAAPIGFNRLVTFGVCPGIPCAFYGGVGSAPSRRVRRLGRLGAGLPRPCPGLLLVVREPRRRDRDCGRAWRYRPVVALAVHRHVRSYRSGLGAGERDLAEYLAASRRRVADERAHRCEVGSIGLAATALGRPRPLRCRTRMYGTRGMAGRSRARLGSPRAVRSCARLVDTRHLRPSGAGWNRPAGHRRRRLRPELARLAVTRTR